jgi:hypothetical protein
VRVFAKMSMNVKQLRLVIVTIIILVAVTHFSLFADASNGIIGDDEQASTSTGGLNIVIDNNGSDVINRRLKNLDLSAYELFLGQDDDVYAIYLEKQRDGAKSIKETLFGSEQIERRTISPDSMELLETYTFRGIQANDNLAVDDEGEALRNIAIVIVVLLCVATFIGTRLFYKRRERQI